FFPDGDVQVARAKVWHPASEQLARDAQLLSQVTKFKFFGRSSTSDTAAIAKNFVFTPPGLPAQKDVGQGAAELNALLFAACLAGRVSAPGQGQEGAGQPGDGAAEPENGFDPLAWLRDQLSGI